ncbi:nuclease A inhibitor family protein [Armatimonas sp.]|uniref:nuclease A inhibitor family protein n=1 Tax=Armatimonas sp. TaxID=1872638 RepID=UPI00374CFB46
MAMTPTMTALRAAAKGLIYSSESDAPLKAIKLDADEGTKTVLDAVAAVASVDPSEIQMVPLEKFLALMVAPQAWHTEEEKAVIQQFLGLQKVLEGLEGVAVYRVGEGPDIDIYIIGVAPEGGYAGVKTKVTET